MTATPSPSTKHLTDEELKQQYGIHMTSRIEADGESKEAKWADFDDEEDDWAPESIEWADGTKVSLNHTSTTVVPRETTGPKDSPGEPVNEEPIAKPKPPQIVSTVGPNATILKVGASAERQQAQKTTSSQKGPVEKAAPSTVKSPAPVPAKSPWAPLPPIDKLPPVTINPVTTATRNIRPDPVLPTPSAPIARTHSPAKEISADDFNRSWRESQTHQPRELFMPNSGRYEAVDGNRRKSFRNDQGFRAPALLQRPSPSDSYSAEDTFLASQINRGSSDQEAGLWSRRRTMSTQSGGSGVHGRRLSVNKAAGADVVATLPESPRIQESSTDTSATELATNQPAAYAQKGKDVPLPSNVKDSSVPPSDLALIAEQKRVMQETARQAVQRRREEELQEEAARKERIRIKLEQLGPPPEHKNKNQEPSLVAGEKSAEPPPSVSSPPKPPVPEPTGKPQQYGMMKVYAPDNVKKIHSSDRHESSPEVKSQTQEVVLKHSAVPTSQSPEPVINGVQHVDDAIPETNSRELNGPVSINEDSFHAWPNTLAPNEPLHSWKTGSHQPNATTGPLWGSPHHDKALGNGTFDKSLTNFPTRDLAARTNPPQHNWLSDTPSPVNISPQMSARRMISTQEPRASNVVPAPEQRPLAANSEADSLRPIAKPMPIGPPQAHVENHRWQQPQQPINSRNEMAGVAGWNNFHALAASEDQAENEKRQRDHAALLEEEARGGIRRAPPYTFNETWKQVEIDNRGGDRHVSSVAKGSIGPVFPAAMTYGGAGAGAVGDRATNGLPVRGSRFFPTEARRAVTSSHTGQSHSPSPPPAEELGSLHPAYEGGARTPIINFPVPKAVVKLPPKQLEKPAPKPASPERPRTFAAALAAQPPPPPRPSPSSKIVSQPTTNVVDWQNRINGLFDKKSPSKKQVLAITPSSREPMDVMVTKVLAAVSLPPQAANIDVEARKATSKVVEETEDLFEDREAASRPMVQIPRSTLQWHDRPTRVQEVRLRGLVPTREVHAFSVLPLEIVDEGSRPNQKKVLTYVRLPGTDTSARKNPGKQEGSNSKAGGKAGKGHNLHFNSKSNTKSKRSSPKSPGSSGSFQTGANSKNNGSATNAGTSSAAAAGNNHKNGSGKNKNTNINTNNSDGSSSVKTSAAGGPSPAAANTAVPAPRSGSGYSHNTGNRGRWKANHQSATGVAH